MADLGQQTVEFSTLVRRAAEDSFLSLTELVEKSPEQLDPEKKISLLKYIIKTRQRMLRLHVLAKWCQQIPLVQYCQQLASTLSSHDTCFTQAADSLFFMHEGLQQARAPIYDVPSAIEVLLTGTYQRVPKCIEDVGMRTTLAEDQRKPALKKLDTLLRSRLLEVSIPKDISEVTVSDGTVELRVDGEFKIMLTLGYRGHLSLWRILHIELLVGEKNGLVKLEETRRFGLGDDLERRMAAAENPFMILYSILHEFCVALIMDTVIRQVQTLRQGRWKDAICFELIADGNAGSVQLTQDGEADLGTLKTPGLRIAYWLEFDKNSGGSDLGSAPFIKIEPGQDLQIKCLHSVFVIDPLTGNEAEFFLDQSCIDAEQLLLRAIACNIHTRLLEVHKELGRNCQICQAAGDVVLKCHTDEFDAASKKKSNKVTVSECGEEVLCVRAYGSSYITLGINIRNGRFLLQSSRNILAPSLLLECEESLNQGSMAAAEVFIILRHKSILHLFASISRFLGLKVYEHGLAAIKIPKSVINGSDLLLMEFPQCGNSYYLLMQLDKDFKPVFKLLVSQPDACGSSNLVGESNQVSRFNRIDIGQMQIVADEVNLSLLDWERLHSSPQNSGDFNQTSEQGLLADFGLEASTPSARCPQSSFSSLVEDVFEYEKGASQPSTFFIQNHIASSLDMPHLSHIGSVPVSHQGIKAGIGSPKWEGNAQLSHISNAPKVSTSGILFGSSLYPSSSLKGLLQTGPSSSLSSLSPVRSPIIPRLSASKSDQELTSLKSPPHAVDASPSSAMDEDQMRVLNDYPKEVNTMLSGSRQTRLLSPLRGTGSRVATASTKPSGLKSPPSGHLVGSIKSTISSSWTTSPVCQTPESVVSHSSNCDTVVKHIKNQRKRSLSDILNHVPSLQSVEASTQVLKRRKISEAANSASQAQFSSALVCKTEGYTYGNIISEANHGRATSSIYVTILLHVVRHCSLCIMHARLTSQMDALAIPYVEEVGLRNPSSNFWFRLPFTRDDSWQHICLRLGRPGSMSWDVKVNDQHFRDLWELQKENTTTPWGSGVRIANTSDVDSHICYDPEGVVLSYRTVEASSIQKLMADLRRLSNARLFALGMRGLLGVKVDDKTDDGNGSSEIKSQLGAKGIGEITDNKMSEQMRRAFRIEAVGLMSLWFSYFGSMPGIVARFVVEWEAGKEGCTMHVSPDQLWPHTKFLEDFINGAEVASLLDCIHLTAGPLLALAGAIRPARMMGPSPVSSGVHSATTGLQAGTKQNGFIASQGPLSSGLPANIAQNTSGTAVENPIGSTSIMGPVGTHNPHGSAMLSIAGRGGPGIVPSSLLPIDVSVVLRGPYWIRIIYRKNFAVDMRCFAGDQVWLQPATPPKGGPAAGGSLPCPQFRPFIMEHVAQGLNTLESTFTGGSHAVGIGNSNNMILSSGSQQAPSGNRANMVSSGGASRSNAMVGNPGANLSRVNNSMPVVSSLVAVSSGLPLRMAPSTGVPVHVRGELNTAFIGLGDDGGYGGGWVPLAALKKVLRGILKYLGVLWLFAQLPDLLKEILGSILKDNEGTLLNLDQEQPALRFFVGGYVFAVSVHRVQLLLQVLSVRRFHYQQQQQQQQSQANAQDELTPSEISEICDYFSRRVASEPYDASRVASFITLLTLPISVLREFLKLISWKKGLLSPGQGDMAPAQRPRIELCLENHSNSAIGENPGSSSGGSSSSSKSNFIYDRPHNSVDFGLTIVLDPAHIPHINAAGGAAWLPYCVSIRLRYLFGESAHISLLGMEGSHGGQACWLQAEDWERCKQRVARAVEFSRCGTSAVDANQGRLRIVAETLQKALQSSLQQLRDGGATGSSSTVT